MEDIKNLALPCVNTNTPGDTLQGKRLGSEPQHCKRHERGQDGGEEVDGGDGEGIAVTVVVPGDVGGVGDDRAEA